MKYSWNRPISLSFRLKSLNRFVKNIAIFSKNISHLRCRRNALISWIFHKIGAFWPQCENFAKSAQCEIFANVLITIRRFRKISTKRNLSKRADFAKNSQNRRILVAMRKFRKISAMRNLRIAPKMRRFCKFFAMQPKSEDFAKKISQCAVFSPAQIAVFSKNISHLRRRSDGENTAHFRKTQLLFIYLKFQTIRVR